MVTSKFLSPKNDVAFRKIFGSEKHKDILIHFINDVLNLKASDKVEKVTFLSTIQDPDIAYKERKCSRCLMHRPVWEANNCRDAGFPQKVLKKEPSIMPLSPIPGNSTQAKN
ncbi:PD-(D/E)XK nuclease family transposase [Candidatus Cardinium hertigii]|uniref:PD-(D/E)XK nuclease family transposase n=1 Tax=Candidatus Cardinium hertigii TaxID=247481 RepID=UPI003D7DDC18